MIEVRIKRNGSADYVWSVYEPATGGFAEIDPKSGNLLLSSGNRMSLEMQSVVKAMQEFCVVDVHEYGGDNRRKILSGTLY